MNGQREELRRDIKTAFGKSYIQVHPLDLNLPPEELMEDQLA